jgi:hypothetical protein
MDEQSEVVERALGYPYAIPSRSFMQVGDRTLDLEAVDVDLSARVPLLAYGSNAAPEVLARKLGANAEPVPVIRAALAGFDVVYSAHVSAYGSVPATIQPSSGTEPTVSVAYLTAEQLRLISGTEPNYELKPLRGVSCRLEDGNLSGDIFAYLSRHGCLLVGGSEVALVEIAARDRRFPAMSQMQVLERVRKALCPERSLAEFIVATAGEEKLARGWTEALRLHGREAAQRETGHEAVGGDQDSEM